MERYYPPAEESGEQALIRGGIEAAEETGLPIDHLTARIIAGQLHDGQWSALYSLASTGAIDVERLVLEVSPVYDEDYEPESVERWTQELARYIRAYGDRGPVERWSEQNY